MATAAPRIAIVGGVAGGATAAARLMRINKAAAVTVFERGPDVSFANCGLPYYIGREIQDRSKLLIHTPASLKKAIGVSRVFTGVEVTSIDSAKRVVSTRCLQSNAVETVPYDKLLLSPGASPFVPPVSGVDHPKVYTLRNLQDMDRIDACMRQESCKRVVVIGAGFIGIEMAEQLKRIGKNVTLIERAPAVLPQADMEIATFLHGPLRSHGVTLTVGDGLAAIDDVDSGKALRVRMESGNTVEADAAILCIGVRPDTTIAKAAGLKLNARGLIIVNDFMQTSDPNIYAVGDAVETSDAVFRERRAWVALGNVANTQARIAADHMLGLANIVPYKGSLGTSIVRAFDTTLALTGWTEARLAAAKIPYGSAVINADHHAGYYPGGETMSVKVTFDMPTGRLYGAQAVGGAGVDKRVDVLAMAILAGQTIDDLSQMQTTYSPPFGSAKDPVAVVGLAARNMRDQLSTRADGIDTDDGRVVIDVRPDDVRKADPLPVKPGVECYFADITSSGLLQKLDKTKKYKTVCNWGRTAYFAQRNFMQSGFDCTTVAGGWRVEKMRREAKAVKVPPKSRL